MTLGLVVKSGPLAPGQPTTYALYAIAVLWLIAILSAITVYQRVRFAYRQIIGNP